MLVFHAAEMKRGWGLLALNDPRLDQLDDTLAKTGAFPACVNDYGVYDMVGNLDEWTRIPTAPFKALLARHRATWHRLRLPHHRAHLRLSRLFHRLSMLHRRRQRAPRWSWVRAPVLEGRFTVSALSRVEFVMA